MTRVQCLQVAGLFLLMGGMIFLTIYVAHKLRLKELGIQGKVSRKPLVNRKVIREIVRPNLQAHVRQWMDSTDRVTEVVALLPYGGHWLAIRTPRWNILTPPAGIPVPSAPAFIVRTDDPVWAKTFLTPQTWSTIQGLSDAYYEALFVDIRPGQFVVRVREAEGAPPMTEMLIEQATKLAEQAIALKGETRFSAAEAQVSRCGVCGTAVAPVRQLACPKCKVPYHRECWAYNEGCSTFGCGRTESVN